VQNATFCLSLHLCFWHSNCLCDNDRTCWGFVGHTKHMHSDYHCCCPIAIELSCPCNNATQVTAKDATGIHHAKCPLDHKHHNPLANKPKTHLLQMQLGAHFANNCNQLILFNIIMIKSTQIFMELHWSSPILLRDMSELNAFLIPSGPTWTLRALCFTMSMTKINCIWTWCCVIHIHPCFPTAHSVTCKLANPLWHWCNIERNSC